MNIISFSGGKDSTALILWAKENLEEFTTVFCDTGWEHDITYSYIDYINKKLLDGKLVVISSDKFGGFEEMVKYKKRVPSAKARFCTEELKLKPMKGYIEQFEEKVIYVGIRADESLSRSQMPERAYADYYGCDMVRPLIKWSAEDCFNIMKKYKVEPNPLYKLGMKRVGCMPCIMVTLPEVKNIFFQFPDVIEKIKKIETDLGRTFFPPEYIPERFCSRVEKKKDGTEIRVPTVDDVLKYVRDDPDQINMFPEEPGESCMSYYSICE